MRQGAPSVWERASREALEDGSAIALMREYTAIDPHERDALVRACVFAGGFDGSMWADVLPPWSEVGALSRRMTEAGLLLRDRHGDMDVHPFVRALAQPSLHAHLEREEILEGHARACVRRVTILELALDGRAPERAQRMLESMWAELSALIARLATREPSTAAFLMRALCARDGSPREVWFEQIEASLGEQDHLGWSQVLEARAWREAETRASLLERALERAERGEDQWRVVRVLLALSDESRRAGDCVRARGLASRAHQLADALGDVRARALAEYELSASAGPDARWGGLERRAKGLGMVALCEKIDATRAHTPSQDVWTMSATGAWWESRSGGRVELGHRESLRRILAALVRARLGATPAPLTVPQLVACGWPGEVMLASSAADRVYAAIRTLRRLGLEGLVVTGPGGYTLAPGVTLCLVAD